MQQEHNSEMRILVSNPNSLYRFGTLLYKDDFADKALKNWAIERKSGGTVAAD